MIIAYENADPEPMKSWFSDADVRNDALLIKELLAFIAEHSTESVIMADGIITCPHQEGIDYPDGEVCQECTFWKGRILWTGERIH